MWLFALFCQRKRTNIHNNGADQLTQSKALLIKLSGNDAGLESVTFRAK